MTLTEISFGISILFGLHILIKGLMKKTIPAFSVLIHLFAFLIGFILFTSSGEIWGNTVSALTTISLLIAFIGGFYYLMNITISSKSPLNLLGIGYLAFLCLALLLLIIG